MDPHYFEEMIQSVKHFTDRGRMIPLSYTGVQKSGGSTIAFEFVCPDDQSCYFLKISPNQDNGGGELRVLPKAARLFKNETIAEADPLKRMGYIPVPTILGDDPNLFNAEFSGLFPSGEYQVQLQTAAEGTHAERQLPDALVDRLEILRALAKLLRTCARNKIAYVDVKPLEHLFWSQQENGQIHITLIDWGIARCNADVALLAEDIRKYCRSIPEIIYGKKIADLSYRSKLTYPIQDEDRKALIPFLGTYAFNGELPPLSLEYTSLIAELLSGSMNELRGQNRCVTVWDGIISALEKAVLQLRGERADAHESLQILNRQAAEAISQVKSKDLNGALPARCASLGSHQAWALAAVRFTQGWYARVDLIPHLEFDETAQQILLRNVPAARERFTALKKIITGKLSQAESNPELRSGIRSYLDLIGNVLEAWNYLERYEKKTVTDADFLMELSTSTLRVSDPILSALYYRIKNGSTPAAEAEKPVSVRDMAAERPQPARIAEEPAAVPVPEKKIIDEKPETRKDPMIENAINTAMNLRLEADRVDNFMALRQTGFFQRLNEFCLNRGSLDHAEVQSQFNPLLVKIADKIDLWGTNIQPEKYFVNEDIVNSIDWLQNISPIVYTYSVDYDHQTQNFGTLVKSRLSEVFQSIYYALAKEQTSGEPPEILAKIAQIKILRKRLDMENLAYIRSLIDRGEFESANQVINLHYSESPYNFDQLNNEIAGKRKEQADQKTIAIVDSVLNDLTSNDTKLNTARFLNSQRSAMMISDRFFSFKNRGTQMFDLQDELSKTKAAIQEQKKTIQGMRIFLIGAMAAAGVTVALMIILLLSSFSKNAKLESGIARIATSAAQYQSESNAMMAAVAQTAAVIPEYPTAQPTAIPAPTMIPTPEPQLITNPEQAASANTLLDGFLEKDVTFDLNAGVILYGAEDLHPSNVIGSIIDYSQPLKGKLKTYNDQAVNIEVPFNIGRTQINLENNQTVNSGTNIRLYSDIPSETAPILILQKEIQLAVPATGCTDSQTQSFCHGTISIWFDRTAVETNLR